MGLRDIIKSIAGRVLQPASQKYLDAPRAFSHKGLDLMVRPGVFHPGLFISTKTLIRFLDTQRLLDTYFLELGAGSGLISLYAKTRGAHVTATDISATAVANIQENAKRNDLEIEIMESDLFTELGGRSFDVIVVNPPYYPKDPGTEAENAWYCGANFEYFRRFFEELRPYLATKTACYMILSEDCELEKIYAIGKEYGFVMEEVYKERKMMEWNYIFKIK